MSLTLLIVWREKMELAMVGYGNIMKRYEEK